MRFANWPRSEGKLRGAARPLNSCFCFSAARIRSNENCCRAEMDDRAGIDADLVAPPKNKKKREMGAVRAINRQPLTGFPHVNGSLWTLLAEERYDNRSSNGLVSTRWNSQCLNRGEGHPRNSQPETAALPRHLRQD